MNRDERRLHLLFILLVLATLGLVGLLLRGDVVRTLEADAEVQTAFLDLALRDRSRYLAETLQPQVEQGRWPGTLGDILTRNHADYNRDIFLQVFEPDGRLVASSANAPAGLGLAGVVRAGGPRRIRWQTDELKDARGRRIRLVTYPVYRGGPNDPDVAVLGFAQAGLPLPDARRAIARFTAVLAVALSGIAVLFIVAARAAGAAAAARLGRESESIRAAQHRFVADAAHELGTPLAILRGEIDLALRRERRPEEYRAALASCREEIDRLSRISENLLALAVADAGQPLLHPGPCDAAELARRVEQRFRRVAAEKDVTLALEAPGALPWQADAVAVEQVLGNLVGNAVRHTPAGERVTLALAAEPGVVVFRVADTGEGIPPAHLPRLFERFHRVDKARSRSAGGAGLGLAIVKTLVEAHGGGVTVESRLGEGTTVTCRFPARSQPS